MRFTYVFRNCIFALSIVVLFSVSNVSTAQNSLYNEAPMLRERVESEGLPSVDERMPIIPVILQPTEVVGTYGGELNVLRADLSASSVGQIIGYEPLLRWDSQWIRPLDNLAQSIDVSDDVTTFTIHLREGVRWSDGELFTATDVLFAFQSILLNPEIRRSPPLWLRSSGQVPEVEQVDEYTVVFRFAAPNGLFLLRLANNSGADLVRFPQHYLSQFHPEFNEDIDATVAAEGFDNWVSLFEARTGVMNTELPVLSAWMVVDIGETIVAERNPYYWKIDNDFNQLPYIDRIVFKQVDSVDAFSEAIAPASDDVATLVFDDEFTQFSVYDADTSQMTSVVLISSNSTALALGLNLNHLDPILQTAFGNENVRIALSHALNRERMVNEIFDGNSQPYQVAPRPESPFFSEEMAHQYTEYDVALANQLLDEAGYAERDADNFRLDSDGNRITFALSTENTGTTFAILSQVVEDWQAIGIDVSLNILDDAGVEEYNNGLFSMSHDAYVSEAVGGLDVMLQPSYYFPFHPFASFYASGWANWNINPPLGMPVEPPAAIQRQMELYAELQTTTDAEQQAALMTEILDIATEEFLVIGTVLASDTHLLTTANLRNVPAFMPRAFDYPAPAPSNPSQFFIDVQGS